MTEERILSEGPFAPPTVDGPPSPGEVKLVPSANCIGNSVSAITFGPVLSTGSQNGTPVEAVVHYVLFHPEYPAAEVGEWEQRTGLVLRVRDSGSHSVEGIELVDTDAPIARDDEPAITRAAWPFEGSFANYHLIEAFDEYRSWTNLTYTFVDGGWEERCEVHSIDPWNGDQFHTRTARASPAFGPRSVPLGDEEYMSFPGSCWLASREVIPERSQTVTTTRNGQPYSVKVWYADEDDAHRDFHDYDIWWDSGTGLYVEWQINSLTGRLTDTDAPLARG